MQILTDLSRKELKKHGSDHFPFLVSREKLSRYESGSFLWHWHPQIEITCIRTGQMCYKVNDRIFHLKEGDLLFANANVLHAGMMEQMQDCTYLAVTFDAKLIYGFAGSSIHVKYVEPVIQDFATPAVYIDGSQVWHRTFARYFEELIRLSDHPADFYELEIVMQLQALWKLLLQNYSPSRPASTRDAAEYERMKEIITFIEHNYMRKLTLKDFAEHLHLCESECCRLCKRYLNVPLFTFLQEYRIERSLEYLCRGESVSAAADKAGFSDSNYYTKVFAKWKGCSPTKYRKQR